MKKTYWFSFSYQGKNQGVCVVEASNSEEATAKILELKLVPKFDDIRAYEIDDFSEDPKIELDRFYKSEELVALGYKLDTY